MAKKINKNWALIEAMGYTIQRTLGGSFPLEKYEAFALCDSVSWQVGNAGGWAACQPLDLLTLCGSDCGVDLSEQTLRPVIIAKNIGQGKLDAARWEALGRCSECANCHGWLCCGCATAAITPALARECNGEKAWAAARKGGKLDEAMATMIENTPALRAARERGALAAIIPETINTPRRLGGRL